MRKLNAIVSIAILALLGIHGISGAFQITGVFPGGSSFLRALTYIMLILLAVHIVIGIKFTADTLTALKKSGKSYFKQNKLFWARRISGIAVLLFSVYHAMIFEGTGSGTSYRLAFFGKLQLADQILLVLSLSVHILCNIRPLFISLGTYKFTEYIKDILLIVGIALAFAGVAFVIYYLRWNVLWR